MSDPNPLYQWCMDTIEGDTLTKEDECKNLKEDNTETELDLTKLLTNELHGMSEDDIKRDIAEKRRLILDLKRYNEDMDHFTIETQLKDNIDLENEVYWNMIYMAIVLVISLGLAITLIYYFFVFRRK
jgi:hypothetical protein